MTQETSPSPFACLLEKSSSPAAAAVKKGTGRRGRPPGAAHTESPPNPARKRGDPPPPVLTKPKTYHNREAEASRDQMDFHRCGNEAEELFLLGQPLANIAEQLKVTVTRLEGWSKKFCWQEKLIAMMTSPSGIAAMLREQLRKEVQVTVTQGRMDLDGVERITRLTTLINKVEGGGFDFLAAASVVTRRFSVYLRSQCADRDEYHLVSTWVQNFLRTLTDV